MHQVRHKLHCLIHQPLPGQFDRGFIFMNCFLEHRGQVGNVHDATFVHGGPIPLQLRLTFEAGYPRTGLDGKHLAACTPSTAEVFWADAALRQGVGVGVLVVQIAKLRYL